MEKSKFKEAMKIIGEREGISPEEVGREIQKAIDAAFYNLDSRAEAEWAKIPCKGDCPTPEELIAYMNEKMKGTAK